MVKIMIEETTSRGLTLYIIIYYHLPSIMQQKVLDEGRGYINDERRWQR